MKGLESQPIGKDPDGHRGTRAAIIKAFSGAVAPPLLIDAAADADFVGMINRLRGEPGSNRGKL